MAIMKKSELKEKNASELSAKLDELDVEIARERGSIEATGKPSNKKYKEMRRLRARINFFLHKNAKKDAPKAKPEAKKEAAQAPATKESKAKEPAKKAEVKQ